MINNKNSRWTLCPSHYSLSVCMASAISRISNHDSSENGGTNQLYTIVPVTNNSVPLFLRQWIVCHYIAPDSSTRWCLSSVHVCWSESVTANQPGGKVGCEEIPVVRTLCAGRPRGQECGPVAAISSSRWTKAGEDKQLGKQPVTCTQCPLCGCCPWQDMHVMHVTLQGDVTAWSQPCLSRLSEARWGDGNNSSGGARLTWHDGEYEGWVLSSPSVMRGRWLALSDARTSADGLLRRQRHPRLSLTDSIR